MGFPIELNSQKYSPLPTDGPVLSEEFTDEKFSLAVAFPEYNLRFLDELLRPGGDVRRRGRAGIGAGHHLLANLADLQLQAHLVGKHLDVLCLEGGGGLVGGEEPLLVEELHHQLPPTVQSLSQAC